MEAIRKWLRRPEGWALFLTAVLFLALLVVWLSGRRAQVPVSATLEADLRAIVASHGLAPLDPGSEAPEALVALGQALFFDKELSGNRDIACATCHHPQEGSGDSLAVSIGTGGAGQGVLRQIGYGRSFIPRNAPEIFNRGAPLWRTMFWDSRVAHVDGALVTPAGSDLPPGIDTVLAAQALFPVTSADEMRGAPGDVDAFGSPNELALIPEGNLLAVWSALMERLLAYPGYVDLFAAAFPDVAPEDLTFAHAATAVAAFEAVAYAAVDTPWDRYLAGDSAALTDEAKAGALLFYGRARCAACHSGALFTDQDHHSIAMPQVGPGKGAEAPNDHGRYRETHIEADMYAFRTPPLRNVALTAPYGHDGAYSTLAAIVRHHLDPAAALAAYDPADHLPPALQETYQGSEAMIAHQLDYLDPLLQTPIRLNDAELGQLLAFLGALTDPGAADLSAWLPAEVPSGRPVAD